MVQLADDDGGSNFSQNRHSVLMVPWDIYHQLPPPPGWGRTCLERPLGLSPLAAQGGWVHKMRSADVFKKLRRGHSENSGGGVHNAQPESSPSQPWNPLCSRLRVKFCSIPHAWVVERLIHTSTQQYVRSLYVVVLLSKEQGGAGACLVESNW